MSAYNQFSALAITPKVQANDAVGKVIFTAAKKLISSKDQIKV